MHCKQERAVYSAPRAAQTQAHKQIWYDQPPSVGTRLTTRVQNILPLKKVPASVRKGRKYRQITAAIREIGIVQPPVVARHPKLEGKFLLLEGHLRIEALKDLGVEEVTCLVSLEDDAFTYNRQVNRLATIQEHRMILKLVERGISEERIAEALDVNVASIRTNRNYARHHGAYGEATRGTRLSSAGARIRDPRERRRRHQSIQTSDCFLMSFTILCICVETHAKG